MPRDCSICSNPTVNEINSAIVSGTPAREISAKFGVSPDAVHRHKQSHLPAALKQAHAATQEAQGARLLAELEELKRETRRLMSLAEQANKIQTALVAVRELTRLLELSARLDGNLKERRELNVTIDSAEWLAIRGSILNALEKFPDARLAVSEVLKNERHQR